MSELPNSGHALLVNELKEALDQLGDEDFILMTRHNVLFVEDKDGNKVGVLDLKTQPITVKTWATYVKEITA